MERLHPGADIRHQVFNGSFQRLFGLSGSSCSCFSPFACALLFCRPVRQFADSFPQHIGLLPYGIHHDAVSVLL